MNALNMFRTGMKLPHLLQRRALSSAASGFDKIGVVGLGLMGHGICQVSAASGAHQSVIAYEQEQKFLDSGKERIVKSIDKLVAKEKMTAEKAEATLDLITFTTDIDALKDSDFIVEAVIENMDLKRDLYTNLGAICKKETIFASNTSSLSIEEMSVFSGRQDKFVGVHFFNPVQIMKLVEVIRTEKTDPKVFKRAHDWVGDIGKVRRIEGTWIGRIDMIKVANILSVLHWKGGGQLWRHTRVHRQSTPSTKSYASFVDGGPS